jgi:hypothetical protein
VGAALDSMTQRARTTRAIDWLFDGEPAPPDTAPAPEIISTPEIKAPKEKTSATERKPRKARKASVAEIASGTEIDSALAQDRGYTKLPNAILDGVLSRLAPVEQSVYLRLYRLSHGFHRPTVKVTAEALAKACNVTDRTVRTTLARLEDLRLVVRLGADFRAAVGERAMEFAVRGAGTESLAAPETISATARRSGMKETSSKESFQTPLSKLVEAVSREIRRLTPQVTEAEMDGHLREWAREQGHDPSQVLAARRRA